MVIPCRQLNFDNEIIISLQPIHFWQRTLIRYRLRNFGNESQFCCRHHPFSSNADSLQTTHFWQRMLIHSRQLNFGSKSQICCRTHNFNSEHWFAANNSSSTAKPRFATNNTLSAANVNLLQPTHFQQRMLIRSRQLNFSSESQIRCRIHTFGSEHWFTVGNSISVVNHNFAADNTFLEGNTDSLQKPQL
jgi:hypothetical protein